MERLIFIFGFFSLGLCLIASVFVLLTGFGGVLLSLLLGCATGLILGLLNVFFRL